MTIENDFDELMTQQVTVEPYAADNGYGESSFGTAVTYQCRTVNKEHVVRGTDGREHISTSQTWIFGAPNIDPNIDPTDQITLPDGTQPKILSVLHYPDENGAHHCKVLT